jgi:enterochelin esterase-like enzyme
MSPSPTREVARVIGGLVAGALVTVATIASGWAGDVQATLVEMGFDPDRGQLLAGLLVAAIASATVRLVAGRAWPAIGLGLLAFAAVFGGTFSAETHAALTGSAQAGRFDAFGWTMTLAALVAAGVVCSWAASILAGVVRAQLLAAFDDIRTVRRQRRLQAAPLARPAGILLVVATLAVTGPVLGDMLNFGPQVHMSAGGSLPVGLFGGGAGGDAGGAALGASGDPGQATGALPPGGGVTTGATDSARPWLAWRPTGSGRPVTLTFPAPWTGGTRRTAEVTMYLPPGYDSGTRRYPVMYAVPWSIPYWSGAIAFPSLLDSLIDQGFIPPEIAVFVSQAGGPYPDSECVNTFDGQEHFESYLVDTVVPYIDANYRTIAKPEARSMFGFSQGGFCTPNLLFHHPDVFRQAVSFSGYYTAGVVSPQTLNAARPFGGDKAMFAANSPLLEAEHLPPQVAAELFLVISGDPSEAFYGPQIRAFTAQLQLHHVPFALLPDSHGHAWAAVRDQFPAAMELLAARQVKLGVFG